MTISKKSVLSVSLFVLLLWGVVLSTFATPPLSPYTVTDNATDPTCAPGSANCYVSSVTADNGLTVIGSNVELGGTLLSDTTITTTGREFVVQGTNSKFVSGADPLDLFPLIGEAFPGTALSTDGTLTGGVKSYIGALISPSNSKSLTVLGNFDIANGIQAAMVAEDNELNIYSSDGVSGSSNVSLSPGSLSLGSSDGIDIYANNYIRFNNFGSGRDDSGTNFPTNFLYTDGSGNLQSAPTSLLGGGSSLKWYAENASAPTTAPVATGTGSIALGDGAQALSGGMFVYGLDAGNSATSASHSNFIGIYAGGGATNANNSNFFGYSAGQNATNAYNSNFLGGNAGYQATNANNSNFIGGAAGSQATNASYSNFLGSGAGSSATIASYSNFLGSGAGSSATNANNSNFLGSQTGYNATNAYGSNFLGPLAGYQATNASNSIFIGRNSGDSDTVDNTTNPDDFSILLGNYTSTGGFENSIALGQRATNTSSNQFMIGSTTRPIDETKIIGSLGTECTITTGTGMACTSDERLKTNITDLNNDTLSKLQNVRTVSYNWLQNPNSPTQIGFLAQNLEQYFPEMVMTDATGKKQVYYSQMTPILVEAIREMNLKIIDLSDMAKENTWRDALVAWFESSTNGIQKIFTKEVQTDKLCVGQTCVTESQLQQLLQAQNIQNTPQPTSPNPTTPDPLACTAPQVLNQTGDACVDPEPVPVSEETPPTDTPPTEEPPTVTE
jgi:hypothetical protein